MRAGDTINAIETRYAGHRFRSRLEARWAVFFDTLGVKWEYEPQGYEISDPWGAQRRDYLPDFWLPGLDCFAEVKGHDAAVDWDLLARCVDGFAHGLPECSKWSYGGGGDGRQGSAVLLLGPIPREPAMHLMLANAKAATCFWVTWEPMAARNPECPLAIDAILLKGSPELGHLDTTGEGNSWYYFGRSAPSIENHLAAPPSDFVQRALDAARSARFEHGERGRRAS